MKKIVCLVLLVCFCLGLAACGSSAKASTAPAEKNASPAAAAPAAATPAPTPAPVDLQPLVDSLNEEEVAQRTEDDPSIGIFELTGEENTIRYKFSMNSFQYVVLMAQDGDAESVNAYNRVLESLPPLEVSLENALRESTPDVKVAIMLMANEFYPDVVAYIRDGAIVYDLLNGIGTAPTGVEPILEAPELSPELQAKVDEALAAQNDNAG